jgi:hypothetical protein
MVCPAFTADNEHDFAPAEPECEHPVKQLTSYEYNGDSGSERKTWRHSTCLGCGAKLKEEVRYEPEAPTAAQDALMQELIRLRQEMESDEPEAPVLCHCGIGAPGECATGPAGCGPNSEDPRPPRRPPYAVAYAVEGGAQYEIALPGDATIRAHEGALIITHASAVLALTQARPMEN